MELKPYNSNILKKSTGWLIPIFFGCVSIFIGWLVIDVSSNSYVWNAKGPYFIARMEALGLTAICSCLVVYTLQKIIKHYALKKKRVQEYLLVFLFGGLILNAGQVFTILVINKQTFLWKDNIISNATAFPMILLGYFYLRSEFFKTHYTQQALQIEKMKSQQFSTELDYLKAQYHPHFLFNALNTVYFQIEGDNKSAKHTVELLSSLLRYQIYDIKNKVTLEQEIEHLKNYIEFQKLRTSERLKFDLTIDVSHPEQMLHPLLFQPLIENAFKYVRGNNLRIICSLRQTPKEINFTVQNTVNASEQKASKSSGVGIENLKRRLELLYPKMHTLKFETNQEQFKASVVIQTGS